MEAAGCLDDGASADLDDGGYPDLDEESFSDFDDEALSTIDDGEISDSDDEESFSDFDDEEISDTDDEALSTIDDGEISDIDDEELSDFDAAEVPDEPAPAPTEDPTPPPAVDSVTMQPEAPPEPPGDAVTETQLPPPAAVWFSIHESGIVLSWDPVPGADSYNVYHDDFFDSSCSLGRDGSPRFCSELATGLRDTSFVHADAPAGENYYWVTACNSGGCSQTDEENPARPIRPAPTVPAAVWFSIQESGIVLSWDPVPGADSYNVYHDDFFDSSCSLGRDGSPRFCSELATGLRDTSFVHADAPAGENYYWVTACNSGGCSQTDEENPARVVAADAPPPGSSTPPASEAPPERGFSEGVRTVRSIPENLPGGINVGPPVSGAADGDLRYTLGGPDSDRFVIVADTGQIRTRDGVVYDAETSDRSS